MEPSEESKHNQLSSFPNLLWDGLIAVEILINEKDITSLDHPVPYYLMLPRMSYLPCFAEEVIDHFKECVPEAPGNIWFEFDGEPLKWHLPVGVLYDLLHKDDRFPWRLTVHFQDFPVGQVTKWEGEAGMKFSFAHALKQSLFLQHGTTRKLANKDQQESLWQGVKETQFSGNLSTFLKIREQLAAKKEGISKIPVRIVQNGLPILQLPIAPMSEQGKPVSIQSFLQRALPSLFHQTTSNLDKGPSNDTYMDQSKMDKPPVILCQGVQVPLNTHLFEAWETLAHADLFLYLSIRI
mmetsp:Transcript_23197/g.30292  ORF Transcript_23197/g.30292 Transcript_23197/m.30292 type:complete len:295 (+) Transcript_23197:305-1189(+)